MNARMQVYRTVILIVLFAALMMGLFARQFFSHSYRNNTQYSRLHATLLTHPKPVSTFTLLGIDGKPFSNANFKEQWTLLFFGFTQCPSVCPTTMTELAKMMRGLEQNTGKKPPQVVMVSLDPSRDDFERLGRYVHAFHPQFYGVTSSGEGAVKGLAKEFGIAYSKVFPAKKAGTKDYTIEHSGSVMLINPKGELMAFYTPPHHAAHWLSDLKLLLS